VVPAGHELGVSVWLERLSAKPAGRFAGVHIGTEAFAVAGTTEFLYCEKNGLGRVNHGGACRAAAPFLSAHTS